MDFSPRSREEKLIKKTYTFFHEFAEQNCGDDHALVICHHVMNQTENAIHHDDIQPILVSWKRDHPEEESLNNSELLWALENFDSYMTEHLEDQQRAARECNSTRSKLSVINGGLSHFPDRPYIPGEYIV